GASRGFPLSLRLAEARSVPRERAGRSLVYRGAAPGGGDVIFRATAFGVEDFVAIDSAARGGLSYELTLKDWTRGLRLVNRSLELLDERGAPRLRMQPPYLVDARGARRPVAVAIAGCAVDTDARAPFSRAVVPPGNTQCVLRLTWDRDDLAYPIVVD